MIKVQNCHKDSMLKRMYMSFDTDNTASGAHAVAVICPVKAKFESLEYTISTGCTASAGTGLHAYVYSVGRSAALIDNSQTGAVTFGMSANNSYKFLSATADLWNSAGTVVTINISATGTLLKVHGIATFVVDGREVK